MRFELTLLGAGGAMPAYDRWPTAQVLSLGGRSFLLDCGEGTQIRLQQFGSHSGRIDRVFISHLHGDHFYGLIGLLTSFGLGGRSRPLHIHAPAGLEAIIGLQLRYCGQLPYALHFHTIDPQEYRCIYDDDLVTVHSLPLIHSIPTCGFLFRERDRPRTMRPEQIRRYGIPFRDIPAIKAGGAYRLPSGRIVPNDELTLPPPPPRAYAFCTDTVFHKGLVPLIRGVDLLYHEASFCEDQREQARLRMHATAREAATIARQAGVGRLVLGHYSARYRDLTPFLTEARAVFPATELGIDGACLEIPYPGRRI